MKLVQKKCPNCGANLEFDKDDTETTCSYCNAKFAIERENEKGNLLDPSQYVLRPEEARALSKVIIVIFCIVFIFVLIFMIYSFVTFPRINIIAK